MCEGKRFLDDVLLQSGMLPPALQHVAQDFGCEVSWFHKHFPDEAADIVARRHTWVAARKQERQTAIEGEVRRVMMVRQARGRSLSMDAMAESLSKPGLIRDPWTRDAWRRVVAELGLRS